MNKSKQPYSSEHTFRMSEFLQKFGVKYIQNGKTVIYF